MESFTDALVQRFPSDRTLIQPDVVELYPNLGTDLTSLRDGRVTATDAEAEGTKVSASASKAARAVSGMDVSKFFPSTFEVSDDPKIHGHGATMGLGKLNGSVGLPGAFGGVGDQPANFTGQSADIGPIERTAKAMVHDHSRAGERTCRI